VFIDDPTFPADDENGRHPSQLEQVDFLPVQGGDRVLRIGQAGELKTLLLPRAYERARAVGADDEHLGAAGDELVIILAQLRQMLPAERSAETSIEDQHDVFMTLIGGKVKHFPLVIGQLEIGCRLGIVQRMSHYVYPIILI